jgi:hypothetical protein
LAAVSALKGGKGGLGFSVALILENVVLKCLFAMLTEAEARSTELG